MNLLQTAYMTVLNPVYKVTGRINEKIRNGIIFACCFMYYFYFFAFCFEPWNEYVHRGPAFNQGLGALITIVLIVFSIKSELRKVAWNPVVFWLNFLSGLGIFIISLIHPIGEGYVAFAMLQMFGFPCLYFIWNNREDTEVLYDRLAVATCIGGILLFAYSFFLAFNGQLNPMGNRIAGKFFHSGYLSMMGMPVAISAAYMLTINKKNKLWFALAALALGTGIKITMLGGARTCLLCVMGSLVALPLFLIKTKPYKTINKNTKDYFIRAFVIVASVAIIWVLGDQMEKINTAVLNNISVVDAIDEVENSSTDAAERFDFKGKGINSYSSGRIVLWTNYASKLNLIGNDFNKTDWKEMTNNTVTHAHNNFLEIGYRCGIPVACVHLIFEIVTGAICVITFFRKKYKNSEYYFSAVFVFAYIVTSLLDVATLPFERVAPFFFYMSMIPVFVYRKKDGRKS